MLATGGKAALGGPVGDGLGDAEINDLRHRAVGGVRHENIGGLYVPVDEALLVRVPDRAADLEKQFQTPAQIQAPLIAIIRDALATHELHDEEGPTGGGDAGVEHARDVGMLHERQRLLLGGETRDHAAGIHAGLDDLERDFAAHRLALLGEIDRAKTAFAQACDDAVAADALACRHLDGRREALHEFVAFAGREAEGGAPALEKAVRLVLPVKQLVERGAQRGIVNASLVEEEPARGPV